MSELSYLEKLLDGVEVEWLSIKGVAEVRSGWGFPKIYQGKSEGIYPFYKVSDMNTIGNETVMSIANNFIDNGAVKNLGVTIAPEGTVIFPKIGAAIATNKKRLLSVPSAYDNNIMGLVVTEKIISRYMFYWIQTINLSMLANDSGAVPSIRKSDVEELPIPIPCPGNPEKSLAIQSEIVRILDTFTTLTAELTAELTARKKQYSYYRDQLLSFDDGEVEWKTLGEIAENLDSKRKPITSGLRETGKIPYYGASGIVDYVRDYIFDGDYLLVSEDGANLIARNTPIAFSISGKTWVNNHAHVLKFETYAERKYVEYYLNSIDLTSYISGAAQPKLNKKNLESIKIPNPAPKEKELIVAVLDKFDTLTSSITEGLPREIELRQKQYEYYRDLLFSFPKPESVNN
ncbi:TPA: restriction endonuclease subunit S [Morganella morganii subsp. morganii]|nr:restriction endonuclease subunit S [Morganella morganii]HDS2971573.1 restriction endonuclease subunit S [Morganella morganii subsp. morganii]